MSVAEPQPAVPKPRLRWFHLTPDRAVIGLLAVEALLWLSNWLGWPPFYKGYAVLTAVAAVGVTLLAMLIWLGVTLEFVSRFPFSIRTLLIMFVAVALPFIWLSVARERAKQQSKAILWFDRVGDACYDWEVDADLHPLPPDPEPPPPGPRTLRILLGVDFFSRVVWLVLGDFQFTDVEMEYIRSLTELQMLWFDNATVGDVELACAEDLTQLRKLGFSQCPRLSDTGLEHIKGLIRLESLTIPGAAVSDAGLKHLKRLTHLRLLDLRDTRITDAGLEQLRDLTALQELDLYGCQVTDAGVEKLQQALPNCKIEWSPPTSDSR